MKEVIKIAKYSIYISMFIFFIERSFTTNGFQVAINELFIIFGIHFIYSFFLTIINYKYFKILDKFISWNDFPKKRLIFGIIGAIIITMIGITILRYFVVVFIENGTFQDFLNTAKNYYLFSFIITVNILITIHAVYFFKEISKKKIQEHKVISTTETAKFESLKNQLDPHFLFNSLNVLTSLIEENPKQAVKFTTKLSKIYRYVLQQKNQDLIQVNKELNFAKTYMDLLKIRFEDSIDFNIIGDLEEHLKIVPLSLQLLLENAVKHNEISTSNKLTISIYKKDNYLIIENNVSPKTNMEKSTKVGLNNIKERYALVCNSPIIIVNNNKTFKVKLPLLTKKQNTMNTQYNNQDKYARAQKKVNDLKEFYSSLVSFLIIIPMLFFIWKTYTPNVIQWFWFPFVGWGFSLIVQALNVYNITSNWEERKIQKFMDDENSNQVKF